MKNKKQFLRKYRLQQKKIERLREMIILNPRNNSRYLKQIAVCEKNCEIIEAKINAIDNELFREILFLKYVCGKTLKEIAVIIEYSLRHTERMHMEAVREIEL